MCNKACLEFGERNIRREEIAGKRVIEVGSMDVNGTFRQIAEPLGPGEYIGVDIKRGPGVDEVLEASELVNRFGSNSFDVVISTEMLEHVKDWRNVVSNLKRILKPGGIILITTRSKGFWYHGFPFDFWRFEIEDIREIFSDMEIESLESDTPAEPGVFVRARKPMHFEENDLTDISLYSIMTLKYAKDIGTWESLSFRSKESVRRAAESVRFTFIRGTNFLKRRLGIYTE